jgi:Holliday junction resolvase RusA-like endonuclease
MNQKKSKLTGKCSIEAWQIKKEEEPPAFEKTYSFGISGTPIAKARPRGFRNKANQIRMYTPKRSKDFENAVRQRAEKVFKKPLQGPLRLEVTFFLPRPNYLIWKTKPMPAIFHSKKPDASNFLKSIEDALNGVAYHDDGQIAQLEISKYYQAGGQGPWTQIEIREIGAAHSSPQ